MLKQILKDMYVDPELLAELSEEQKQILFFKMRQEQIRKWKEREAVATLSKLAPGKAHGKSVQWKLGADGDVWVWVMGEHPLDKPYNLLCSEILAERVRQQSLLEAEAIRSRPAEKITEPPATLSSHSPSNTQRGSETHRERKSSGIGDEQSSVNKTRSIEEMLAESMNHQSRKYGFQQSKDLLMKMTGNETSVRGEVTANATNESLQKLEKEDPDWVETLRRSKAADERRRSLAKNARDDYKRLSLQGIHKGKAAEISKIVKAGEQKQQLPPPLPPKPKNLPFPARLANGEPHRKQAVQRTISSSTQEGIVRWFKEEQLHLRAGFEKSTDRIAPWFHGILTTKKAEELLRGLVPGSFLIRVSEKIRGYVLSYLSAEGCKHFLIDASGDSYSFLGVDQLQHSTLADLVDYHKDEPITSLGKELLRYPCDQQGEEPDYLDLFE
ncbi:SH2 domain-containing protein 4A [Pogona vitticeps]